MEFYLYPDQVSLMFPSYLFHKQVLRDCGENAASGRRKLTPSLQQLSFDLAAASPTQDNHNDGATDAAPSPPSPFLPHGNTYQLPNGSEWLTSGSKETHSPSINPSAIHGQHSASVSPDLGTYDFTLGAFNPDLFSDLGPLFDGTQPTPFEPSAKYRKTSEAGAASTMDGADTPPSDEPQIQSRKRKSPSTTPASSFSPSNGALPTSPVTPMRRTSSTGGPKKTAHNMIEKRYRNNLNDRINTLRDLVPTLRAAQRLIERGGNPETPTEELDEETREALGGLEPPPKLNKATVLAKSAEYILHLEKENEQLKKSNAALLKSRKQTRTWA